MKTKMNLVLTALIAILVTSCTSYYQVYRASPSDKTTIKDNYLVYEDENCQVLYNFWGEGGNVGFQFYNKTETNIYLNLDESFFVLNGVAFDYFKNRIFTNSTSSGTTTSKSATVSKSVSGINLFDLLQTNRIQASSNTGLTTLTGNSISFNEAKLICIPSKTSKIITEYNINDYLYRDCDLYKYPTKKQVKSKSFSKTDSPIIFSNRITYTVERSENKIHFENEFYISEISNYPEGEMLESKFDEFCGQKSGVKTKYFRNASPDKFYIKYTRENDTWIH